MSSSLGNATGNSTCPDGYQVIYHSALFSHECITTPLALAAVVIGFSSVICWFFAQAPQVIKSWRSGEADKTFSLYFLVEWALGDTFNLVGSLLSHQLSFQIWQAGYFCLMDVVLVTQFLVARINRSFRNRRLLSVGVHSPTRTLLPVLCCLAVVVPVSHLTTGNNRYALGGASLAYETDAVLGGRRLLSTDERDDNSFAVFLPSVSKKALYGYILGSISAFFYIIAGFPQAVKNYRRKSCEGLALSMFVLAALGNSTYALGILLYSTEHMFLLNKLPWLAGSIGSLLYQFTILVQFFIYRRRSSPSSEERASLINNDYAQPVDYADVEA